MELKNFFAQDDKGNSLPNATCYLYFAGTSSLASGLQNKNNDSLSNPFVADNSGLIQFAAPNGRYDLRVVKQARDYRIRVQCTDIAETLALVADQIAAAQVAAGDAQDAAESVTGSASVAPAANKIPRADADGKIDMGWLSGVLASQDDLNIIAAGQAKQVSSYSELKAYDGPASVIQVVGKKINGFFVSGGASEDGGTCFSGVNGKLWARLYHGAIQIEWFSPVNDGVASDATAINAALLANHNRGGGAVVGSSLLWRLGSIIHCGKNTSLFFDAKARIIRGHNTDLFRNDLGVTAATTGYAGNGGLEVWGGQWEGNPAQFYNTFTFFQIGNADGVLFKHCTFIDAVRSHVFDMSAVKNVLFEDCKFLGFAGAASATETTAASAYVEAIQVDPNVPTSFPFGACDGTPSSEITVRRCEFGPNPAQSDQRYGSWGCAIGQHGSFHNQFMSNIRIENCIFDRIGYAAIRGMRWNNVWITNNTFKNCKRDVESLPIAFNSVYASTAAGVASGIGQTGKNWTLKGNIHEGFAEIAVLFGEIPAFNTNEAAFFHEGVKIDDTFSSGSLSPAVALRFVRDARIAGSYKDVVRGIDIDCCQDVQVAAPEVYNITEQFCYIREQYLVSGKSSVTKNINIFGAKGSGVGSEFLRTECAAKDVNAFGNNVSAVCRLNGALGAIAYYGGASGGLVACNTMRGNGTVNPSFGLYVNASCSGITESSNLFDFSSVAVGNNGTTKPPVTLGPVSMDYPWIGASGSGVLQFGHWVAGAYSPKWQLSSAGNLTPLSAATYNIGSSNLPLAALFAKQVTIGTTAATQVSDTSGALSPESSITAAPGSTYRQINGNAGKFWVKETGTGNTGWVAK